MLVELLLRGDTYYYNEYPVVEASMVVRPLRLTCPPDRLLFRGITSPDKHTLKLACRNNDLWLCEIYNHKLPEVNARILPSNGNTKTVNPIYTTSQYTKTTGERAMVVYC